MIIRPSGCQPTLKIRTRETRRSDCRLDHCLVLAVQPGQWDVDVRSMMMDAVSCRSSVSQATSTMLHVGAVAERMLTRPISRYAVYANQTMFEVLFRPSVTERFERFWRRVTSTMTFDQRSTGHAIPMLRGTAGRRSYVSSTQKKKNIDFGCARHRATWRPHHDDGTGDGGSVHDANPSTLRRNANGRQPPTSQSPTGGSRCTAATTSKIFDCSTPIAY